MPITKATASSVAPAAKGDLVVGSATNDAAILGVGTNNQVLTADSAEATGMKWATAASGGMTVLATGTLSGTSVTLSTISGSYVNLFLIISNPYTNSGTPLTARINGVTSADYSGVILQNAGTATDAYTSNSSLIFNAGSFNLPTSANNQSYSLFIPNYAAATFHNYQTFSAGGSATVKTVFGSHFSNTSAAVTSIQIRTQDGTATFSGGTYTLYGVS
jgi:hypothetical protein